MSETLHEPRYQDWSTIAVGDLVMGKDKHVWQCIERNGTLIKVERADGKTHEGEFTGEVQVVATAAEDAAMAVAMTQVRLGGVVVATQDAEGRYLVPTNFPDGGTLLSHCYLLHGVSLQEAGLRDMTRKHEWLHRPENKVAGEYVPHHHDPDFYKDRAWEPPPGMPR